MSKPHHPDSYPQQPPTQHNQNNQNFHYPQDFENPDQNQLNPNQVNRNSSTFPPLNMDWPSNMYYSEQDAPGSFLPDTQDSFQPDVQDFYTPSPYAPNYQISNDWVKDPTPIFPVSHGQMQSHPSISSFHTTTYPQDFDSGWALPPYPDQEPVHHQQSQPTLPDPSTPSPSSLIPEGNSFLTPDDSSNPASTASAITPPKKSPISSKDSNTTYTCPTCNKTFPKKHILNDHTRLHTRPCHCPYCPKRTAKIRDLNRHIAVRHRELAPAVPTAAAMTTRLFCHVPDCLGAAKGFARHDHLKRHVDKFHNGEEE